MASKSKPRARPQKKPAVKGLARKELEVAQKVLPIRKATYRKRTTSGQEDCSPVTAALAPATLSAPTSTSTQTLARRTRTRTGAQPVVPTLDEGNAAPVAVSEVSQDLSPAATDTVMSPEVAAEMASLRAQIAMLQGAQEVVASPPCQDQIRIPRPANVRNLRKSMQLGDYDEQYPAFRADLRELATIAGLKADTYWKDQNADKVVHVTNMMKDKYPFLKRYDGDWPIKEYLKRHLTNKRHYNRYSTHTNTGKVSRYNIGMNDLFNFGSEEDARNEKDSDDEDDGDES